MNDTIRGYATSARVVHWIIAILVLMMIPAGLIMVQKGIPRSLQDGLYLFHKNFGVIVLLLMIVRLVIRRRNTPPPLPDHLPGWQKKAADFSHIALYVLLFVMPISGYIRVRADRFPIEGLDALGIGPMMPKSKELAAFAQEVHFVCAWLLMAVVAMHIGAALQHALIHRDGVFQRMWPPVKR